MDKIQLELDDLKHCATERKKRRIASDLMKDVKEPKDVKEEFEIDMSDEPTTPKMHDKDIADEFVLWPKNDAKMEEMVISHEGFRLVNLRAVILRVISCSGWSYLTTWEIMRRTIRTLISQVRIGDNLLDVCKSISDSAHARKLRYQILL